MRTSAKAVITDGLPWILLWGCTLRSDADHNRPCLHDNKLRARSTQLRRNSIYTRLA